MCVTEPWLKVSVAWIQCPCYNQPSVVAVRCVCVQEAEAARTLQAQGTIAELQRQLVSGTTRTQSGGLRALFAVMCVCTDRFQHGAWAVAGVLCRRRRGRPLWLRR